MQIMSYISINGNPFTKIETGNIFPSPTFSYQSHHKWASKLVNALDEIHKIAPPTHWATIKANEYLQTKDIRLFLNRFSKAIEYRNTKMRGCFAVFAVPEIDDYGVVHFHALIRSQIEPLPFISAIINKHNIKNSRKFSIDYIEKPESVDAVTKYITKLGRSNINLFSSGSLSRYSYCAGRYFLGKKRKDLTTQALEKFFKITETTE